MLHGFRWKPLWSMFSQGKEVTVTRSTRVGWRVFKASVNTHLTVPSCIDIYYKFDMLLFMYRYMGRRFMYLHVAGLVNFYWKTNGSRKGTTKENWEMIEEAAKRIDSFMILLSHRCILVLFSTYPLGFVFGECISASLQILAVVVLRGKNSFAVRSQFCVWCRRVTFVKRVL